MAGPQAVDLLSRLLAFDPSKRLDAAAALTHPYLASLHLPDDEPDAGFTFDWFVRKPINKQKYSRKNGGKKWKSEKFLKRKKRRESTKSRLPTIHRRQLPPTILRCFLARERSSSTVISRFSWEIFFKHFLFSSYPTHVGNL